MPKPSKPLGQRSLANGFVRWKFPISVPQLAPVAMMLIFAFFVFSQTVSADGSISGIYQKSFEISRANLSSKELKFGVEKKLHGRNNNERGELEDELCLSFNQYGGCKL